MTYDRAIERTLAVGREFAAVSHGLTSSPRWGEGAQRRADVEHERAAGPFSPWGEGGPKGPDEGAFTRSVQPQECRNAFRPSRCTPRRAWQLTPWSHPANRSFGRRAPSQLRRLRGRRCEARKSRIASA